MKIQKSLLAVIAMAGTMGFSAVASAMDFSVYGSLRGGLYQQDKDDTKKTVIGANAENAEAIAAVVESGGVASAATAAFSAGITVAAADADEAVLIANIKAAQGILNALQSNGFPVAADFNELGSVDVDVSGASGTLGETAADGQLDLGHGNAGSRIGIRGSEDLGNGAEAGLHWETGVGADGSLAGDGGRHANVWYSGAFGKITIGQQNNPYRSAANWDQSWWLGGANRYGDGGSRLQGVRYDGQAGAFNFSVMANADNDTDFAGSKKTINIFANGAADRCVVATAPSVISAANGAGQCTSYSTLSYEEVESETGIDSWIATGHYDMGVATINLGYRVNNNEAQEVGKSYDNFVISANGTLDALSWYVAFENNTDNSNVKRVDSALTAATGQDFESSTTDTTNADANKNVMAATDALATAQDTTTIGLFLGYALSDVSTLYFEWEDTSNDGLDLAGENLDKTSTLLGFSRSIGPNTSFIAEYSSRDYNSEETASDTRLLGFLKVDF